jgi:hypothetical protein
MRRERNLKEAHHVNKQRLPDQLAQLLLTHALLTAVRFSAPPPSLTAHCSRGLIFDRIEGILSTDFGKAIEHTAEDIVGKDPSNRFEIFILEFTPRVADGVPVSDLSLCW